MHSRFVHKIELSRRLRGERPNWNTFRKIHFSTLDVRLDHHQNSDKCQISSTSNKILFLFSEENNRRRFKNHRSVNRKFVQGFNGKIVSIDSTTKLINNSAPNTVSVSYFLYLGANLWSRLRWLISWTELTFLFLIIEYFKLIQFF